MQILTPAQITQAATNAGTAKATRTKNKPFQILILAILGGAFLALGAALSVTIGYGFPEAANANPALQKIASALTFPIGLTLIVVLGAELFTGNNALLIPAYLKKQTTIPTILANWTIVWVGNFLGALAFTLLFIYLPDTFTADPWQTAIRNIAQAKATLPWGTAFLRGIAANWCVCLAIWLALSAKTLGTKALGCWLPVATFVAMGFEHSIANMFFIPCGMIYGADITIAQLFTANLIPVTLGNILGGALLVGTLHTHLHPSNP